MGREVNDFFCLLPLTSLSACLSILKIHVLSILKIHVSISGNGKFNTSEFGRPACVQQTSLFTVVGMLLLSTYEQAAQIKEIFDLFDTDGGGTIDRHEVRPHSR